MRHFILCTGWLFIAIGIAALLAWFFGDPHHWMGAAAVGQLRVIVASGFLALIVIGILMVVGETDSRS